MSMDEPLKLFVAMPGTSMGEHASWDDPDEVKELFFERIGQALAERLDRPVDTIVEKDRHSAKPIPSTMFGAAWDANVFIADLTGNNHNVYLELGVRWAVCDGVTILVSQDVGSAGFNVRDARIFQYSQKTGQIEESIETVVNTIIDGLNSMSNPDEEYCDSIVRNVRPVGVFDRNYVKGLEDEIARLKRDRGEDLVNAALSEDDPERRLELLRQAEQINPNFVDGLFHLGIELRKTGAYPESVERLQKAITLEPERADLYRELGVTYNKAGQLDLAASALREAVRLDSQDSEALSNLGGVLRRKGLLNAPDEYDSTSLLESREAYFQASKLDPHDTYPRLNVVRLNFLLSKDAPERKETARADLKALQSLCTWLVSEEPEDYWKKFDLADTYLLADEVDEGYRVYQDAMESVPEEYQQSVFTTVADPLRNLLLADVVEGQTKETIQTLLAELEQE